MSALFSSASAADAIPAPCSVPSPADVSGQPLPMQSVGTVPHIGLRELERHLSSCHLLMQLAKARYRGSRSLEDACEAARWATLKEDVQNAILALRREQFNADEGCYFAAAGDQARAALERKTA